MVYDFNEIIGNLKGLRASSELIQQIEGISELAKKGHNAEAMLKSVVDGVVKAVSDAEASPLSGTAAKSLEAERGVLDYLDRVLYHRE